MKTVVEELMGEATVSIASYDQTKISLGSLMKRVVASPSYVRPLGISLGRPLEVSGGFGTGFIHVLNRSSDIDEIFLGDFSTAATSRSFQMWTYTRSTEALVYVGKVTMNTFCATAATIRGFKVLKYTYNTGTVDISGTGVTGHGTAWQTARFAPGRLSVDGGTTWTDISSIGNDTTITLSTSGPTVTGSSFILEEYRILISVTAATTVSNGGLFLLKGVHPGLFQAVTSIGLASGTDNLRNVYWLADAASVTNTVAMGADVEAVSGDFLTQNCYVPNLNSATAVTCFKYNVRASLGSLASGKSTSAWLLTTGSFTITSGSSSQNNCAIVATLNHGPSSGVACLYMAGTNRIYRAVLSNITSGNTSWVQSDYQTEVPPGGTATTAAVGTMTSIVYLSDLDRLFVTSSSRGYITSYNTTGLQMDHIMFADIKQQDQSTEDPTAPPVPGNDALYPMGWYYGGVLYMLRQSTVAATNQLYTLPVGIDWTYTNTTNQRIVFPVMNVADCNKAYRVYAKHTKYVGPATSLGVPVCPFRVLQRTSNFTDATSSWATVPETGDLTGLGTISNIQFAIEYRGIGQFMQQSSIYSLAFLYENTNTDSHYAGSVDKSSMALNIFAWRQSTTFGGTIPNLRITLRQTSDNSLILTDTTALHASGTWQYSTDGASWNAWSSSADAIGNYIRYTASSLAATEVSAVLSQA